MKVISILTLVVFISCLSLIESLICNGTTTCLHGGVFNLNNCTCTCPSSAYSGRYCQYVSCSSSSQPSNCSSYPSTACGDERIKNYCPLMCNSSACTFDDDDCNIDSCLNGGTYNGTTCLCQCANYYNGRVCEKICSTNQTCSNGGVWSWTACACTCPTGFFGLTCANSTATACASTDPSSCATTYNISCTSTAVKYYCPHQCGQCTS